MSENVGRQARRQAIAQRVLFGAFILGFVSGAGYYVAKDLRIAMSPLLLSAGCAVLLLLAVGSSIVYWRNIDEAAREAHKFAWFWGGSSAMLLTLLVALLVGDTRLVAVMGQQSPAEWFSFGVTTVIAAQLIGYGLAWAGWWLRQR
ncbi:hypothetical protein [Caulobacter segnis]|uniref:hypothetical protein n=1 Tax=Caulobacter segnis TaxID=88688 RepID=UPI002857F2B3|nr:hypothetical protein [Caulobacter segnis]MDR6626990.1 hypothetical protein [Caulobacter segnis]